MNFFNTIFKRVSSFPILSYDKNKENIFSFFNNNSYFQLSVLIASRSLYEDAIKNKTDKTKNALEKYFNRAHFKSVPFGGFSSVGNLEWGKKTSLTKSTNIKLNVGFDHLLLANKIRNFTIEESLELEYSINPSFHFLNDTKISFYKYRLLKDSQGELFDTGFVELDYDENVSWLITRFANGEKLNIVIDELILEGFEKEAIETFLLELIDIGFLINKFIFHSYSNKLYKINSFYLSNLIKNTPIKLDGIKTNIAINEFKIEQDFFSGNSESQHSHSIYSSEDHNGNLDVSLKEKIKKYIEFNIAYNKHDMPMNKRLNKFASELQDLYGDGFHSITKIFNPNSGLKYSDIKVDHQTILHKDIMNKIINTNANKVYLNLLKIKNNDIITNQTSATFSVMLEMLICKKSNIETIYLKNTGGATALKLLNRFGFDSELICQEIAKFEKEIYKNQIVAEVNMVANLRSVNVLAYQQFHDYQIPINTSSEILSNPILLSDIFIHLENGNFSLYSKKHNKQIIPKITSAINFNNSDSEIYKFLGEMCFHKDEFFSMDFNLNIYPNLFIQYAPRIYLEKDILLYGAQILLVYNSQNFEEFKSYLIEKLDIHSFGKKFVFFDAKGEIVLDTDNDNHLKIVFDRLKDVKHLYIVENLYESFNPAFRNDEGNFAHELVVSVKNTDYVIEEIKYDFSETDNNISKSINEWLYFDLYSNTYAQNDILKYVYNEILTKYQLDKFFFIRYKDLKNHLRVRFKTNSLKTKENIIVKIHELKNLNLISKYQILPYEKEITRYGGVILMEKSENIFDLDSYDTIVKVLNEDIEDKDLLIVAILKIKYYLNFFNFSLEEQILFCENCVEMFSSEFKLDSELRKKFNKEYAEIRTNISEFEYFDFLNNELLKADINKNLETNKLSKTNYIGSIIHMSMNRLFNENQRFNEFKTYYLAKCYFNQIKFTMK